MTKKSDNAADDFLNESGIGEIESPKTSPIERKKYTGKTRQLPVSLGISKKCLPPLTRRKMAVYELLNLTKKDPRIIGGETNVGDPVVVSQTIEPPPFEFSPTYQFDDRGEEDIGLRRKTMVYTNDIITYNKAKQLSPKEITDLQLDIPTFTNGQLIVDCASNFIKYTWLELHPQNESNKWRDKTRRSEFKRVDIEYVSPHINLLKMDLAADAEDIVRKMSSKEIINLAAAFAMSPALSLSDMKLELRQKARFNPELVLYKTPDKFMATQLDVIHAMNMGILDYNPDQMEYLFSDDEEPFYIVPLDATPLESVAKYLTSSEGGEAMEKLKGLLDYWPTPIGK